MVANLSPTVEIRERDVSNIIPSVTTSVGGIVIHTEKGPLNKVITLTSVKDLETVFGRPNEFNYTHWFTAEAFLKQSNNLKVVRIEDSEKAVAGLTYGISGSSLGSLVLSEQTTKTAEQFPLTYENIKQSEAKLDYTLPEGTDASELDNPSNSLFDQDIYHWYAVGPGTTYEKISVLTVNSADYAQLIELKGELAQAYTLEERNAISDKYFNGTVGTTGTTGTSGSPVEYLSNSLVKYDIFTPPNLGAGETDWIIHTDMLSIITAFEFGPDEDDEGVMIVFDETGSPVEQYLFSHDPEKRDSLGNKMFGPEQVNDKSSLIYFFIGNSETSAIGLPVVTTRRSFLGNADALTENLDELTGEIISAWNEHFTNTEELNVDILLDPDYRVDIKRTLDTIAKDIRKDCFVILNMPKSKMLSQSNKVIANVYTTMRDFVAKELNINSSYSAIYGNYFKIYDRFAEKYRWVPVSGYVGAIMASVDFNDAPWFAIAGLNRAVISNVDDVAVNPNKAQRDILYPARINAIINKINDGIVIWGQKTLQSKASAFDRINVRRLFITLEKAIKRMSEFFLFEFNDDISRTRFRGIVNPYLSEVQAKRGVYDYLVVCDDSNNTPEVIDRNEFRAEIMLKPTRVAEYIKLTFTAVSTGVEFSEVVERY